MIYLIKYDLKYASSLIQKIFSDLSSKEEIIQHDHFATLKEEFNKLHKTINYRPQKDIFIAVNELLQNYPCAPLYVLVALLREIEGTDHKQVIKLYDAAITDKDDYAIAYTNRGELKRRLGDTEGAMKDLNKAIEIDPNFALAYISRGALKERLKNTDGAMEDYNKAIEIDPNLALTYANLGALKGKLGDTEGAIEEHNKCIEINLYSKS